MMKTFRLFLAYALGACLAIGCSSSSSGDSDSDSTATGSSSGQVVDLAVQSTAVRQGTTTENDPTLYVYLPPSYATNEAKRYPVAYFFHGFGDSPEEIRSWASALDALFTADPDREMIVVSVTGQNSLGGSFYVDSPVSGNWETYVVDEAIPLVDQTYRTIARRDARGVFGFSMGGFGALNLALRNPDAVTAAYAFAPGLFDATGLRDAWQDWQSMQNVVRAYAAAFANGERPTFSGTPEDNAIVAKWENGYGNASGKIAAYAALPDRLSALRIDYGTGDEFDWIPRGCRHFIDSFAAAGIACESTETSGNHAFGRTQLAVAIAFFQSSLSFN